VAAGRRRGGERLVLFGAAWPAGLIAAVPLAVSVAGGPIVDADIDEAAWKLLPAEPAAVGYRVLAEALTNVRRHAPETRYVQVSVRTECDRMAMTVTNELPRTAAAQPSRGGRGLGELVELVRAGGGQLTVGPVGEVWRLRLTLPATGAGEF